MRVNLDGNYPDCCNWTLLVIQVCCMICTILAPILAIVAGSGELASLAGAYGVY